MGIGELAGSKRAILKRDSGARASDKFRFVSASFRAP